MRISCFSLSDVVKECPGNTDLYFHILDPLGQMNLTMQSKLAKVSVKKDLISYIQSKPLPSYKNKLVYLSVITND